MKHFDTVFSLQLNRMSLLLYISAKGFVCFFRLLIASPTETGVSVLISKNDQNTVALLLLFFSEETAKQRANFQHRSFLLCNAQRVKVQWQLTIK